jgi:DNA helicase II / ATP-dependent DNA helicase PcrA
MSRVWSPLQETIFEFAANGTGNAVVEAVAGSGKSTTMVEAMNRVLHGSKIFLAFNKHNADDLKAKGVNARTFHSLTYGPVTKAKRINTVSADKMRDLIDERFGDDDARMYGAFLNRLVSLGKNAGIGCLIPDTEQSWDDLAQHHNLELENDRADYGKALRYASELLHESNEADSLDFDDLLYLAVKDGISLTKFDFIVVDEYQDTNAIQVAVIRKIMHAKSRLMVVGDRAQAIYGFRGATAEAMDNAVTEFNAIQMPLTVTYRCPKAVVEHAHQWVEHIQAHESAPDGAVEELGGDWDVKAFSPGDLVVCRTTRPILSLAYQMLNARVPVKVLGREIGVGLKSLIKKMNCNSLVNLQDRIHEWRRREVEKAKARKNDAKAEAIHDKASCVLFLIDTLKETKRTVPDLYEVIDQLFADKANATILSTIHKAKGLEADTVYWLNSSQCPAKWARQEWEQQQERNLCYVATTRAKKKLVLIEEKVA